MLAAFAVHNAEEIAFLGKLPPFDFSRLERLGLTSEVYRRDRMAIATGKYNPGLVTAPLLLAGAVRHLRLASKNGTLQTPAAIAGVLAGNVLSIPAILASLLIAKRLTPGEPTGQ